MAMPLRQKHLLRGAPRALNVSWPQTPQPLADRTRPRSARAYAIQRDPVPPWLAASRAANRALPCQRLVRRSWWATDTCRLAYPTKGFAGWLQTLQSTPWLRPTTTDREANGTMLRCALSNI